MAYSASNTSDARRAASETANDLAGKAADLADKAGRHLDSAVTSAEGTVRQVAESDQTVTQQRDRSRRVTQPERERLRERHPVFRRCQCAVVLQGDAKPGVAGVRRAQVVENRKHAALAERLRRFSHAIPIPQRRTPASARAADRRVRRAGAFRSAGTRP